MTSRLELGQSTERMPPFKYSALTRVGFSDTDAQGVVYYGRYMPYFDLARVEYSRHIGAARAPTSTATSEFVMRANTVEYFAPARFDDLLEVFVRIARIGSTSLTYEFQTHRIADDLLMVTSQQVLVHVDKESRRPTPILPAFRNRVQAFELSDLQLAAPS